MLSLTAKDGSYLMIGDDIKIVFLRPKHSSKIYVRISAPKSVPIRRDKVFEKELSGFINDPSKSPEEIMEALELLRANREDVVSNVEHMKRKSQESERIRAERLKERDFLQPERQVLAVEG